MGVMGRMWRRCVLVGVLLVVGAVSAEARGKISGYVEKGGQKAVTPGSTNLQFMRSYPGATVTVCQTGYDCIADPTKKATIYSDAAGASKSNPFAASLVDAAYSFYADECVDIRFSGTGIAAPWTEGDRCPSSGVFSAAPVRVIPLFSGTSRDLIYKDLTFTSSWTNTTSDNTHVRGQITFEIN